jgi:hypothetical protein
LVRDAGFGHGYQRDLYAQCWALVYFLRTRHSDQFLTFLDLLRGSVTMKSASEQGDRSGSDRVVECFTRAFGSDLAKLEREWLACMATVRTPLETHAPQATRTTKPAVSGVSGTRSSP